jgi:ABC-type branched-subunit amino acid transport system substrate-binding protein
MAVTLGCSLATAACASRLTDAEVLRANGQAASAATLDEGGTAATTLDGGTAIVTDGSTTSGNPSATGPSSATTAPRAAGGTGGSSSAVGTPGETGPIVLGSVGNYSGPAGAAQAGFPRAVQVWAAATNAKGGLFGRQVKVIVQDDGGDPARSAAAIRDLVENRGVIAFVGQAAVLSVRGGLSYLREHGIPVIGTDCSAPEWYEPSTNLFPQCADSLGQSYTYITAGMRISGAKKLGYVFCGESPACTSNAPLYETGPPLAGGETVYRAQISIASIDFTANCQNAKAAGVEIMAVLADPGTLGRVVRSCDRQGFKPQYVAISISALPEAVKLPGLSRLILGVPTFPFDGASSPAIDEFHRAMRAHLGGQPGAAESAGWVAAKLFELAATKAAAASGSLSSKTLIAAMHTVKGETLGGLTVPLDFTGAKPHNGACAFVMQGDGKGGWTAPYGAELQCVPGY